MVRIRLFEEVGGRVAEDGRMPTVLHLYIGQEAVAAGVCANLRPDDQITSTHRGHGHFIAKGGQYRPMFSELFGRANGACKGKGGSMHISDIDLGILGANGIVGGGIPIAVGAAFSNKYRGSDAVSVSFFGDGATNEGSFHEAANMAALWKLPCVLVCENNFYGEWTPQHLHQAIEYIADRAAGYGMPGVVVDGMDAVAVWSATQEAVRRARAGEGPTLLECRTYRYFDHVGMKGLRIAYRSQEEVDSWKARDPIQALEARLVEAGALSAEEAAAFKAETLAEIDEAIAFAEASPFPDPAELLTDVYTEATS
ncbi:MAG: thiamine pyrophosphate-dependent dehydrogenase E1 component subunit alpha [Acidobacteria bacterium]|nr:thiamine pyrophosphate-dependent dehydrogenase E1 component subunit alpha [Acidobacteriota bacterium]